MRQILYIGKFFPQKLLQHVAEDNRGKIGFSNHNFEFSLIRGLRFQKDINVRFMSLPAVFSYPHNNQLSWIRAESYEEEGTSVFSIGYCNWVVINRINKICSTICYLFREFRRCKDDRLDIIVNTPTTEILLPIYIAKHFTHKKITTTLIVPDIPAFISAMDKANPIKKIVGGWVDRLSMKLAAKSDCLVLLTKAMMDFFNPSTPYIIMEGIVDIKSMDIQARKQLRPSRKSILYTGTLRRIFGIMNLVEAFEQINMDNVELWICGSGEAQTEIKQRAELNSNIKFLGLLGSKETLCLQHQATVLVNPRTSAGKFTKYSFPSKTMEYLLSGNPVIANRLPGIPEEYFDYVLCPENESIEALTRKLQDVLNMSDMEQLAIGKRGHDFIVNQKNSKIQMGRILNMIEAFDESTIK